MTLAAAWRRSGYSKTTEWLSRTPGRERVLGFERKLFVTDAVQPARVAPDGAGGDLTADCSRVT